MRTCKAFCQTELVKDSGLELAGIVPEDENIRAFDLVGKPIIELPEDSKAVVAVKGIFEKVCDQYSLKL